MSRAGAPGPMSGSVVSGQSFHSFSGQQWCLQDMRLVNKPERPLVNFRATGTERFETPAADGLGMRSVPQTRALDFPVSLRANQTWCLEERRAGSRARGRGAAQCSLAWTSGGPPLEVPCWPLLPSFSK